MPRVDNVERYGRYSRLRFYDVITDKDSNKRVGLRDKTVISQMKQLPYKVYAVPAKYEYRPDLLALEKYGSSKLWWIIVGVNDITHPFKQMSTNSYLKIPNSDQVFALLT